MRRPGAAALAAVLLFAASFAGAAERVAFYYGAGRLDDLAGYDVVVLQPGRYAASDIARLKSSGTVTVLGYISLGEDDRLRRGNGKGPGGYASWYVDEYRGRGLADVGADGAPDVNADWNSYYVDPSDRRWRKVVEEEVRRIRSMGMDGVFADTVLLPEDKFTDKKAERMRRGMDGLVRSLKKWAGGGTVYVNNGYDHLERWAGRLDGLVIETSVDGRLESWQELRRLAEEIAPFRREFGFAATALLYIGTAAEIPSVCEALRRLGLPGTLYVKDADGLNLTRLPDATCP